MDRSAKALESFCEDDEAWVDSWTVSAVGRGWGAAIPGSSADETIGLTDRRLLWLDENLESVVLDDVESVTTDVLEHSSAPGSVRLGAVALVLGAFGSAVSLVVLSFPLATALLPLVVGLIVLVGSIGVARARAETGAKNVYHQLLIELDDSFVTVWGDRESVEMLADALDPAAEG